MAHNINENNFAGRQAAWHGLGTIVPECNTMTEMIDHAGIDWRYEPRAMFWERETLDGTYHIAEPNNVMTINGEKSLECYVSPDFEFFNPIDHAQHIDRLIAAASAGWLPETAFALGKGETTAYCVSLGNWGIGNDENNDFLVIMDTVNGKKAYHAFTTVIRAVCQNTINLGLRLASAHLSIPHKTGHRDTVTKSIDAIIASRNNVREALIKLSEIQINEDKFNKYVDLLFPAPDVKSSPTVVRKMGELVESAQGNYRKMIGEEKLPQTAYAAFHAVQEAIEHSGKFGRVSAVTKRSMVTGNGPAAEKVQEAYAMALVMADE